MASNYPLAPAENSLEHPLRRWRKSEGLTLDQAARAIGTSKPVWCAWELGRRKPNETFMPRVRELTGGKITADTFFPSKDDVFAEKDAA